MSDKRSVDIPSFVSRQWGGFPKLWSTVNELASLLGIDTRLPGDHVLFQHVQYRTGQRIHTIGQPFDMLFAVNSGFLKTVMIDDAGNEQALAFPMKGDIIGIDGIHKKIYMTEAVALTNCDIVLIPFKQLTAIGRANPALEAELHSVLCRELIREQQMVSLISSLPAEARVARFLVHLSDRYAALGYSGTQFTLRMTRQEIGSYLGLTLETVSRSFSAFKLIGLIGIDGKSVIIRDLDTLRTMRRLPPSQPRKVSPRSTPDDDHVVAAA